MGHIYKITNTVNGKLYIGQTIRTIETRWKQHVYSSFHDDERGYNCAIQRAIRKYGADVFTVEEIEECDNSLLDEREIYWIKKLKSIEYGYNISIGGGGWAKCDCNKLLELWNDGYTSKQIADIMGLNSSTVTDNLKGNGITQKEINKRFHEYRAKKLSKPVYQYDEEGYFIAEYPSKAEAKRILGIDYINTSTRRTRSLYGGYQWKMYKTDKIPSIWDDFSISAGRKVYQYTLDGEYIRTYDTLRQAAKDVCGRTSGAFIGSVCRHDTQYAYGYRWSFNKEEHLHEAIPPKHFKKVIRISPNTKEEKTYSTIAEAAKDNNIPAPNITDVCRGRGYTAAGYYWKYADAI